jgi:hypothetical protein
MCYFLDEECITASFTKLLAPPAITALAPLTAGKHKRDLSIVHERLYYSSLSLYRVTASYLQDKTFRKVRPVLIKPIFGWN